MKFLPEVKLSEDARNKNFFLKLQTKIPKNLIFGNAISRHTNFTKFYRIVTIDVRNKPYKFQIDISKIDYFAEHSVKCRSVKYITVFKMRTRSRDVSIFTE